MKILKAVWSFILKHWRWLIPAVILVIFMAIPNKPFDMIYSFISGVIFMGFIWYSYAHYIKNKI